MKTKIFFLSVVLISGLNSINAQIGNYVRNKAVNAAFRAGDKKVDEKIDEAFEKNKKEKEGTAAKDSTKTDQPGQKSESGTSNHSSNDAMSKAMMGKLGITMERPANMKDKYDYTGNIIMTIQSWDENGDSHGEVLYTTHYSADKQGIAMKFEDDEKKNSIMILDNENLMMIMLNDDEKDKTGMVMTIADDKASKDSIKNSTSGNVPGDYYSKFKKTGRTKKVSGYDCDEYVFEDENLKGTYWMTNQLSADLWADMFNNVTIPMVYAGRPDGFVMEWLNENKTSKEKSHMVVKEVNKNKPASFSTVGYTFMKLSQPQNKPTEKK